MSCVSPTLSTTDRAGQLCDAGGDDRRRANASPDPWRIGCRALVWPQGPDLRWDDPDEQYGVLYLGKTLVGPFAESLLRHPANRDLLWERGERKRAATFVTARTLRLAKLHGPGLAWFQTTAAGVSADFDPVLHPDAYETTQRISGIVHADTALDGIQYRSRFDMDELCVALFERADPAVDLTAENMPIDKIWTQKILKPRGYTLIEF